MRTSLILIASVVLLAACADETEPTAPRSRVAAATSTATSDVQTAANPPAPSAKPTKGPVVTQEVSILTPIDGVTQTSEVTWALCPAGTALVGGGHRIESGVMDLRIVQSGPFSGGANGWVVQAEVPSGKAASFRAIAMCLQL